MWAIAFRMTEDHRHANDLAQETFLTTYRAGGRLDEHQKFVAFISRIVINLSIDHLARSIHKFASGPQKTPVSADRAAGTTALQG
jgi:DNA-directed RNA polymerase specialized sigma24 family protein